MEIITVVTGVLDENCYILKKDNNCLLIDPGSDAKKIKEEIGDSKILAVLITHAHFDHIGALRDFLKDNKKLSVYKKSNLSDNEIKEIGDFTFKVLYTKGHSSDSISFYFEDENTLFTGDFLFRGTVGRCDLPTGSTKEMDLSLKRLDEFNKDVKIYPGHGDSTTLEYERETNFYLALKYKD